MNFKNRPHSSRTDRLLLLAFAGCFLAAHLIVGAMDEAAYHAAEGDKPPIEVVEGTPPIDCTPLVEAVEAYRKAAQSDPYDETIPLSPELQAALREACEEHGIPLCLALGLIEVESNFDPDADNGVSVGLMQTNAKYASTFDGNAGYSIYTTSGNIHCGVWYLSSLISRYNGDQLAALTAYNRGTYSGTVSQYARSVMKASEKWGAG